LQSINAAFWLK